MYNIYSKQTITCAQISSTYRRIANKNNKKICVSISLTVADEFELAHDPSAIYWQNS